MENEPNQDIKTAATTAKLRGILGQMRNLDSWKNNPDVIVARHYAKFASNEEAKKRFEALERKLSTYFDKQGQMKVEVDDAEAEEIFSEWSEILKIIYGNNN